MDTGDFNNDIWDEHQWEAHFVEIESMSRIRKFLAPDPPGKKPRWLTLLQESSDEWDAVDAYIEEQLRIEDAYFGDEEDDEWEEDDWDDEYDDYDDLEDPFFPFDEDDDFDEGEEWKELSEEYSRSEYGSIDTFDIYRDARFLGAEILQWIETVDPRLLSSNDTDFVNNVLKIGAKVTGGYHFGFEPDFLGANIVYTKRALHCANDALTILQRDMKGARHLKKSQYFRFHQHLFELRNNIGVYIQELRDQFYRYR